MKPKRIILIRHGQSEGNADKEIYKQKPDFAVNLTPLGKSQALKAGKELKELIGEQTTCFYRSPFYRTRQTHEELVKSFPSSKMYEDPRLREQEHTPRILKENENYDSIEKERDDYGHFYYRFEGGESCADVYDRISDFIGTLFRDFSKVDYAQNCIIVSHGMTNRLFLMRFLHMTVEEFEFLRNPKNCGYYILQLDPQTEKYSLTTEPKKYPFRNCKH